jgi:hypothetical protein
MVAVAVCMWEMLGFNLLGFFGAFPQSLEEKCQYKMGSITSFLISIYPSFMIMFVTTLTLQNLYH